MHQSYTYKNVRSHLVVGEGDAGKEGPPVPNTMWDVALDDAALDPAQVRIFTSSSSSSSSSSPSSSSSSTFHVVVIIVVIIVVVGIVGVVTTTHPSLFGIL